MHVFTRKPGQPCRQVSASRQVPVPSVPRSVSPGGPFPSPQRAAGDRQAARMLRGAGQPLEPSVQEQAESRFGYDFSRVRVHADPEAADAARAFRASAFTFGYDIVFGRGEYAPGTAQGARLLAHELTHVLQQGAGVRLDGREGGPADDYERDADEAADQVTRGGPVRPLPGQGPSPGALSAAPASARGRPWVQRQALPGSEHVVDAEEVAERQRTVAVINVVGHASPRWRSATGAQAADRENARLSEERAEAVRREIVRQLHALLGNRDLVFEYNYTAVDPTAGPADVVLGTESRGSRETLVEAGERARHADDAAMRRVEVSVRLRSNTETGVREEVETTERRPGASTEWSLRITGQAGASAAGWKAGGMLIHLRNEKTGVVGTYLAEYGGGEMALGAQIAQASFSWSSFSTPAPMSFADFDPSRFGIFQGPGVALGIGVQWAKLHFTYFGSHKPVPDEGIQIGGLSVGGVGVSIAGEVLGSMYLQGDPAESFDVPVRSAREQVYSSLSEEKSAHRVLFGTGSAAITAGESKSLSAYLGTVAAQWPSTR
jgi:uncharacterized protein DUF4157